jgi:hypothetical protein
MGDDVSGPLDGARAGRILPEENVSRALELISGAPRLVPTGVLALGSGSPLSWDR